MGEIKPYLVKFLQKHLNNKLYSVYFADGKVNFLSGKLLQVLADKIIIEDSKDKSHQTIGINSDILFHIYNQNYIDLVNAKETITLDKKLRNKELQKIILNKLRPNMGKEVTVFTKTSEGMFFVRGKFTDMGIMGVTLLAAPFYNAAQNLPYRSVMHVYGEDLKDLLETDN